MSVLVKLSGVWTTVDKLWRKDNGVWTIYPESDISNYIKTNVWCYGGAITSDHTLSIGGASQIATSSCQYLALYDNNPITQGVTWGVTEGSNYVTIDNTGLLTVLSGANETPVTITCSYGGLVATKNLIVTYVSGSSSETETETEVIVDPNTGQITETTTTTTTTTDEHGNTSTSTTTTETVTNEDGSSSYTESEENVNTDGSSSSTSTTVNYDENGNMTDSSTNEETINSDGSASSSSVIVSYDENGDVVGSTTNETDTAADGSYESTTTNYDENGDPIDGQNASGDTQGNVNTQTVSYDEEGNSTVTGYTIDTSGNPEGSKDYNGDGVNTEYYAFDVTRGFIVDMKFTVDCSNKPTGQNENHHNILTAKRATPSPWYGFQLRQSSTSQFINLGTQFSTGSNTNTKINPISIQSNIASYDLQIIYDPTLSTDSFKCIDKSTGNVVFRSNGKFPDIEDLKYIKVTVGYAMDENGDPFRYSKIEVENFSIRRLTKAEMPTIDCDGRSITITCATAGADIYYRLNRVGTYKLYTVPISISSDTFVEAYAEYDNDRSDTSSKNCIYDSGVENPVIYCDGETVSISCDTQGAVIYYRINQTGEYAVYSEPFSILTDTVVQAYATYDGRSSSIITETCEYNPEHDYSRDYLTFQVLIGGTIVWQAFGEGYTKSIQYSVNGGQWNTITASSSAPAITVSTGDTVRFKGTNITYAGSNVNYSGFGGGTAEFDVEGNIMSLIYGDNFQNNSTLTGTYNFCSLFKETEVNSAENLILPATTMTPHCYRALFAQSAIVTPPVLPATTLADSCYRYMFQDCAITEAPDLLAPTLAAGCYEGMFNNCLQLIHIKCLATNIEELPTATANWTNYINTTGIFVKDANANWVRGGSGIPLKWSVSEEGVKMPTISCDGLSITLACGTQGATIYYKLNHASTYTLYTTPISINADTFIETYAELNGETSPVASDTCIYDDGIEEPVIYCDGEYITISCETGGAYIYYRLDQEGSFLPYDYAIAITEDTVCEAYAEIDGRRSQTVTENCIYDDTLKAPVIECDGVEVTITCNSVNADIYYRLDQQGNYVLYTTPIAITQDTFVEAYSERDQETSAVVSKNCIYNPTHDYSKDYLTFKVLSPGTIKWNSIGSGQAKTIQYSLNDGAWTTITASSSTTISVVAGDEIRFKGTNTSYAKDKSNYSGFEGGTASFNIEGNIMSLIYGDNFEDQTTMTGTYNFCSIFKLAECVSAENLVLPATTLTNYCYRAMFSKCPSLTTAPSLPATTLAQGCYWYMFEECPITTAPDLPAETLVRECYGYMFTGCRSLNYIKCMAIDGFSTYQCKQGWVQNVASSGTFTKDSSVTVTTWTRGNNGIPTNWLVYDDVAVMAPVISCDGYNNVTITCETQGATIYYRLNETGTYAAYSTPIEIFADTVVEAYASLSGQNSRTVSQTCQYISDDPYEASNRDLTTWTYDNQEVTVPYSVNALDGHSASYAKGTFNFETSFALRQADPTYLWFQHADQSATIYVDNVQVEKHWGGYTAFAVDISNYVHAGTNNIKVAVKNNEGNNLAPASGDFNFNATLGKVKLFTSPYVPDPIYGYDGFHVTSTVTDASATIYVKTSIPTGASVVCTITDGTYNYTDTKPSTGMEMTFTATVTNPHLWNGTIDPHLYTITLEVYHDNELYHRYVRPYGLRYYEYVINEVVNGNSYTGFLLNGQPYLLRGVCMHDDIKDKANALNDADYTQTFNIIQELGCNFLRLAHYPHPKEVYDRCDQLGIVVQTEGPCVNKMQSTMPTTYYDNLNTQYDDMVNQHYNHPCIMFWGLSNETTTDDKAFANTKINGYISRIKALDSERMIGYVMAQSAADPSGYYNDPNADWFGCNMYEGWYTNKTSNDPTAAINTRIRNLITNKSKVMAYSEYGCGGTQRCHSDDFMTTTTRGNYERHDIEYMMWLHEGHIAAIKNYPQLLFTAQWQLFDIAVASRNEGYTVCLDGVNTSTDDELRRLNNKGLVERDHITKKDTFYLYKAWWNPTPFIHICGKNYTKTTDRVIKCYTNAGSILDLYVNNTYVETVTVTDNIAVFTSANYNTGDIIRVQNNDGTISDTLTF